MQRILTIIFIFILSSATLHVLGDDSIPDLMLDDVVVKADRGWIENGIVNVIPTKSEKKLSNSPASLIGSMNLPYLREKDGIIVSPSGKPIAVFINGERAADIDIATFYSMNVKRIQYVENPSDPRYEGVEAAVNFIMPVYEYGGVTRANLFQKFIRTSGNGEIASKLVYRKMTYGVMVYGNYSLDRGDKDAGETRYRDLYYDGVHYDEIIHEEENLTDSKRNYTSIALNAKYSTEKTSITHTLSFLREHTPSTSSESHGVWSDNLFGSSVTTSSSSSKSLSPQISGIYFFTLPRNWYLYGSWAYSYARNDAAAMSRFGITDPVTNSTKEDVNSCRIVLYPSYIPSDKLSFNFLLDGSADFYSTRYAGSANILQHQSRKNLASQLRITWRPKDRLNFRLEPGVNITIRDIADLTLHSVNPSLTGSVNWNPSRRFNLSGSLYYLLKPATPAESNPVLVQNSQLMWSLGNPRLKDLTSWDTYVYATYMPDNMFSLSCRVGYSRTDNWIYPGYSPADPQYGGLVRENLTGKPKNHFIGSVSVSGNFLNGKLSVNLNPAIHHTNYSSPLAIRNHTTLQFSGDASYTLGDLRFQVSYDSPYSDIDLGGLQYDWRQDYFNFRITYGTGNLYISALAEDLFHRKEKRTARFSSVNYYTDYVSYTPGRRFSINITYTFDYGRKVDRSIDISGPSSAKTSVASF
ncbi:MAG: hypothetical protein K2L14_07645 [Duncaniella sp.]|nr:hypothetical protein [Duncaniella sp.]